MLSRAGREEEAAQPCVPGVRSDGIKAASLSFSLSPSICISSSILPHHFFCLITHSPPLCVNIGFFENLIDWLFPMCRDEMVKSGERQSGQAKDVSAAVTASAFHLKNVLVAHRHDMLSVVAGLSPALSIMFYV